MHLSSLSRGTAAVVALATLLTACSTDTVSGPKSPNLLVEAGAQSASITMCNVALAPALVGQQTSFAFTSTGGALTDGRTSPFALTLIPMPSGTEPCSVVWYGLSSDVTQITEQPLPAGMELEMVVIYDASGERIYSRTPLAGAMPITNSVTIVGGALVYFKHVGVVVPPPPPPGVCDGLTPGYWKNWANHYTAAQFASLLTGTVATSIANAEMILEYGGNDPVLRLRKFVLANQLTLNLTGTTMPNPDTAGLSRTCSASDGGPQLGTTLDTALAMLANPSAYTRTQINAVKDVLDMIANLD